jgi:hypothetical protein
MKRFLKVAVFSAAQTPTTQWFGEYIKQGVALNVTGAGFKANMLGTTLQAPGKSDDPVTGRSFSEAFSQMQADSSNGGEFGRQPPVLSARSADPARNESFADRFARMQAESSNSGEFRLPVYASDSAFAKANGVDVLASRGPVAH